MTFNVMANTLHNNGVMTNSNIILNTNTDVAVSYALIDHLYGI